MVVLATTQAKERMNPDNLEVFEKRKAPTKKDAQNESHIRIADQLDEVVRRFRARGYSPKTIKHYSGSLCDFERYMQVQGLDDLRAVLQSHVEGYKADLRRRKLSSSTQAQRLQAVSRLFEDLNDRGLLLLNPAASVQRISRRNELPKRVPTEKEMERLFAAANTSLRTGIRDRAILEVLYGSLLRASELCSLTVHDVDFDNRLLRVTKGKGSKGRMLPIGSAEHRWLEEYLSKIRPWWAKRAPKEHGLFLTNRAEPMNPAALRQMLLNLCNQAKLKRIGPHAIRHAAATHMVAAGADIRHVQKLLGHAHLITTQIYTKVMPTEVKATHERTHPREQKP